MPLPNLCNNQWKERCKILCPKVLGLYNSYYQSKGSVQFGLYTCTCMQREDQGIEAQVTIIYIAIPPHNPQLCKAKRLHNYTLEYMATCMWWALIRSCTIPISVGLRNYTPVSPRMLPSLTCFCVCMTLCWQLQCYYAILNITWYICLFVCLFFRTALDVNSDNTNSETLLSDCVMWLKSNVRQSSDSRPTALEAVLHPFYVRNEVIPPIPCQHILCLAVIINCDIQCSFQFLSQPCVKFLCAQRLKISWNDVCHSSRPPTLLVHTAFLRALQLHALSHSLPDGDFAEGTCMYMDDAKYACIFQCILYDRQQVFICIHS